jgi:long-chain acyl-CoA synthetase
MLPNCPEVLISYQGILRCGAVIVPLIPVMNEKELTHILGNCEAIAMITTRDIFQKNEPMLRTSKTLKNISIADENAPAGTFPFRSLIRDASEEPDFPAISEEDLAVSLYTAGTISTPKGIILTHKNLYSNAVNTSRAHGTKASNITSVALPLSHSFGITSMNKAYTYGNLHVLMRKFQVEEAFKLIEKYRVTNFPGVPAMFITMLNSPDAERYELSSWKSCLSGTAPFPVANLLAFQKRFHCTVFEAYGLSEASPAVSTNYHNRPTKPGSIGQPIPEVAVRIVDDQDQDVPPGDVGELLVKGPNVSSGYYKLPEETAKTFRNGWLHTGDMAKMDEGILYQHPAVKDAVAIGVPDPVMGEEVKVYVVLKEGETATAEELLHYSQNQLAKHKWPKFIEFTKSLPRNPMGKILRKELRKLNNRDS